MKEKRDCKIVQDLLPSYIDELTNEETNSFIEEHIKECSKCKQIFENMKQDLTADKSTKDSREVKYIKKYNKKLKALKFAVFLLLIIALGVMTSYYLDMKRAALKGANMMVDMVTEGMYPNIIYATIEEISDSEFHGEKDITVKGFNINDTNHKNKYYFPISLDSIGDNFKIKWNGKDINFEQLKVGQKVVIYNYRDLPNVGKPDDVYDYVNEMEERGELSQVKMIVVLDDTL